MTGSRDERSYTELKDELVAAVGTVKERCEAQDRAATDLEIGALDRLVRQVQEAWQALYRWNLEEGYVADPDPLEFDQAWWDEIIARLRKPPAGAEFRAQLAEQSTSDTPHPGGAPLERVMSVDDACRLQDVIDRALRNGNELVIADLARRFDVTRRRIRQAIAMRKAKRDLFVSPPELRTVTDRTGFVYWEPLRSPRKP